MHALQGVLLASLVQAVLATPWAYVGNAAPDYWAELDNDYALCGVEGDEQSPINLDVPPKDLEFKVPDPEDNHVAMEFNYSDAPVEVRLGGGKNTTTTHRARRPVLLARC